MIALALAAAILVVWDGPPPPCPRLGRITVARSYHDAPSRETLLTELAEAARAKAAKRGADTIYVIRVAQPHTNIERYTMDAGLFKCATEGAKEE